MMSNEYVPGYQKELLTLLMESLGIVPSAGNEVGWEQFSAGIAADVEMRQP